MRTMIALLVLGTSLALAGNAAFAEGSGDASHQVVAAPATDFPAMGPSNSTADPRPWVAPSFESHQQ